MTVPIPQRKPDFSSTNGSESGFLDSILSTVENVSNSAFNVSANYLRIKQMFDGQSVPTQGINGEGAEVPPSVNNPTNLNTTGGIQLNSTMLIGLRLGLVGLLILLDD